MAIKRYNPTTPSRRFITSSTFEEITKSKPEKSLLSPLKKTGGRNAYGRVTVRFRGGGHKQMYRIIDFKRDRLDIAAKVLAIEYDPLFLVFYGLKVFNVTFLLKYLCNR